MFVESVTAAAGPDGAAAITDITSWLFGANADEAVVETVYAGSTTPVIRYRRDFLTGALVDRSIRQAATEACRQHEEGSEDPGVTTAMLAHALAEQVENIVRQLTEHNVHHYVDVPGGSRVASVRPLTTTRSIPAELERSE